MSQPVSMATPVCRCMAQGLMKYCGGGGLDKEKQEERSIFQGIPWKTPRGYTGDIEGIPGRNSGHPRGTEGKLPLTALLTRVQCLPFVIQYSTGRQ